MTAPRGYHVLTRSGDAQAEVDRAVASLGGPASAGLHRQFYVSRANQTVVMTPAADSPIAMRLRSAGGWMEPGGAELTDG